jgi:hypothetical protein
MKLAGWRFGHASNRHITKRTPPMIGKTELLGSFAEPLAGRKLFFRKVIVPLQVPGRVICRLSALRFQELTTQQPNVVWMAIGSKAWRPTVNSVTVRVAYYGESSPQDALKILTGTPSIRFVVTPARETVSTRAGSKRGFSVCPDALGG